MCRLLNVEQMLVGSNSATLMQDCRKLRDFTSKDLPDADEVIVFLDGYNSFINHEPRPFKQMREVNMLL